MKRHEVGRQEELKIKGLELYCETLSQTHLPKQQKQAGRLQKAKIILIYIK